MAQRGGVGLCAGSRAAGGLATWLVSRVPRC